MFESVGKTLNVDGKGDGCDCLKNAIDCLINAIANLHVPLTLLEKNIERRGIDNVNETEAKKLNIEVEDGSESSEIDNVNESEIYADQLSAVDVLQPSNPIKEFKEFNLDFDDVLAKPDYKFGISKISSLVKQENVELFGKPFKTAAYSQCSMQIKCMVNYDQFQLFVAIMTSEKAAKAEPISPIPRVITSIMGRHSLAPHLNTPDALFCYNFPEEIRNNIKWGTFYPFCKFTYERNIASINTLGKDHVILHFFTRNSCSENDVLQEDGILLWKVDALISKLKAGVVVEEEDEIGLSPVFYKDPKGVRVQVRLFTRGTECKVQVIFYNETEGRLNCPWIDFKIFHPTKPTQSIDFVFDPLERKFNHLEPLKSSFVSFQFAKVEELVPFVDRYLWVKVKM